MKLILGLVVAIWIGLSVPALCAVDLTQMDRTLRKEPAYRSKSPQYCLLVFGPNAETRVWLALDLVSEPWEADGAKNALYVDRNGNGDLTEADERVSCTMQERHQIFTFSGGKTEVSYAPRFLIGDVVEQDGSTRHTDLTIDVESYVQDYRPCVVSVKLHGRDSQVAGGAQLRFSDRPQDAPIIHFGGPLQLRLAMETGAVRIPIDYHDSGVNEQAKRRRWYEDHPPQPETRPLVRGQVSRLDAQIGTPGLGLGTFAALSMEAAPKDVHPVAQITFLSTTEAKAVPTRLVLNQRCCGTLYYGTLSVPSEVVSGATTVDLSFPDWVQGRVQPITAEVLVADPR